MLYLYLKEIKMKPQILNKLAEIERENNIEILFAVFSFFPRWIKLKSSLY